METHPPYLSQISRGEEVCPVCRRSDLCLELPILAIQDALTEALKLNGLMSQIRMISFKASPGILLSAIYR